MFQAIKTRLHMVGCKLIAGWTVFETYALRRASEMSTQGGAVILLILGATKQAAMQSAAFQGRTAKLVFITTIALIVLPEWKKPRIDPPPPPPTC